MWYGKFYSFICGYTHKTCHLYTLKWNVSLGVFQRDNIIAIFITILLIIGKMRNQSWCPLINWGGSENQCGEFWNAKNGSTIWPTQTIAWHLPRALDIIFHRPLLSYVPAALFIIPRKWKQPMCPTAEEQIMGLVIWDYAQAVLNSSVALSIGPVGDSLPNVVTL